MKQEKWMYDGKEIIVPIVDASEIEKNIDVNLEDTMEFKINDLDSSGEKIDDTIIVFGDDNE